LGGLKKAEKRWREDFNTESTERSAEFTEKRNPRALA